MPKPIFSILAFLFIIGIHAEEGGEEEPPLPPVRTVYYKNSPIITKLNPTNDSEGIMAEIVKAAENEGEFDFTYLETDYPDDPQLMAELVNNGTYDMGLGYVRYSSDPDFSRVYPNLTRISIFKDTLNILRPNLLKLLVLNVLREMFFFAFVIYLPWLLINMTIFYLIELKKFQKYELFRGLWESLKTVMASQPYKKMSSCSKVYSLIFYILSIMLTMLLLGDFIYVVSATLLKSDNDNINEFIFGENVLCVSEEDYLVTNYFETRPESVITEDLTIKTCF